MHLVLEGLFQDEGGDYRPIRVGPPQPFVFEIPALIIEGVSGLRTAVLIMKSYL
jgi:hypothetical protein